MAQPTSVDVEHRNEVRLTGRLAALPLERTLPSGDVLVTWRLVVRRVGVTTPGQTIDTIDCVSWRAGVQKLARQWAVGDLIECDGALRRRFWRMQGSGPVSRCEVDVVRSKRIRPSRPTRPP